MILAALLIIAVAADFVVRAKNDKLVNLYKIEINRVEQELRKTSDTSVTDMDLSAFKTITGVVMLTDENADSFYESDNNYKIADIDGKLYRIEYTIDLSGEKRSMLRVTHIVIALMLAAAVLVMVYIYSVLIRHFNKISEYPTELAKGNLTIPLSEEKSKYFGRFLWGLDMLREKLEDEKRKNLELQKERNVFLLSLSHDMKTPISAIKLYAAAIKKNLYKDPERLQKVAAKIDENANEAEGYVAKIISASGDDFLNLNVKSGEFYLSEAITPIKEYYSDKLKTVGTELNVGAYTDVLLKGDREKFTEVLQNIFENAIKYGDGGYIKVSFADEEDARLVTITNSGCTLKEEETEHIFDSFYRGTNVGSKPGSGLGLYICRKLIHKMGGEIFAEIEGGEMRVTVLLHRPC